MTRRARPSPWPTVVLCGLGSTPLAVASLAAPWFVVYALMIWIAAPVVVLLVAGLTALAPSMRAGAWAVMRGVGIAVVIAVIPSALVLTGAMAQMGDNYF